MSGNEPFTPLGILAGLVITAAAGVAYGVGRGPTEGVSAAAVVLAFVAFLEFGRGERARALAAPGRGDERERAIYDEAMLVAYLAVVVVALPGALVGEAHGHFNQFGVVCAVGGGAQIVTALWLRTRR